jgi:hypothetical protein
MKPKTLWERRRLQCRTLKVDARPPAGTRTPEPFQPLTRLESMAVLDETIQWLIEETTALLMMPSCPFKELRRAELRARDSSMRRDLLRLQRSQH